MKNEVIELKAVSFGYGFHFKLLDDKTGFAHENIIEGQPCTYKIEDYKLLQFWKKIDALGVWNWQKKYPYWKQEYVPLPDGCDWRLELKDRSGRTKYCAGYASFPRNFNELIRALNNLFGTDAQLL